MSIRQIQAFQILSATHYEKEKLDMKASHHHSNAMQRQQAMRASQMERIRELQNA